MTSSQHLYWNVNAVETVSIVNSALTTPTSTLCHFLLMALEMQSRSVGRINKTEKQVLKHSTAYDYIMYKKNLRLLF